MSAHEDLGAILRRLVDRLAASYHPNKIVLFGSHAGGEPNPDSDIDLLVVKETSQRFLDRIDEVRRLVAGTHPGIPFDPIVLTPGELKERLEHGDQFFEGIIQTGRVLYAA